MEILLVVVSESGRIVSSRGKVYGYDLISDVQKGLVTEGANPVHEKKDSNNKSNDVC